MQSNSALVDSGTGEKDPRTIWHQKSPALQSLIGLIGSIHFQFPLKSQLFLCTKSFVHEIVAHD
jgi:hypothetical protein